MKKSIRFTLCALVVAAACDLTGCAHHGYVNPTTQNFDKPGNATLYDIKTAVAELVSKMQDDEGFQEHYELLASKKEDLPILQIANIKNYSGNRVTQKLESARRRLETALRKTRLFDIVDDAASAESISEDVADSLTKNAEIGLKGDDGLQAFGEHASADYEMRGRYREFHDGDRYSYELSLQLIDLHNGKQVWSDIADIDKE